jgi:hypothetical protein
LKEAQAKLESLSEDKSKSMKQADKQGKQELK